MREGHKRGNTKKRNRRGSERKYPDRKVTQTRVSMISYKTGDMKPPTKNKKVSEDSERKVTFPTRQKVATSTKDSAIKDWSQKEQSSGPEG